MTHGISGYALKCRCAVCVDTWRDYQRQRNQDRYEAGQCRACDAARMPESLFCEACRVKSCAYQQAWRARLKAHTRRLAQDATRGAA